MSCHEPVYWSSCESWRARRGLVHFVRVSRLLLIFDVESALAAASAAVGSCCPLAVGAGFVMSYQGYPENRTAKCLATSTMPGVVDGSSSDGFV